MEISFKNEESELKWDAYPPGAMRLATKLTLIIEYSSLYYIQDINW